jgi:hypothetical protein
MGYRKSQTSGAFFKKRTKKLLLLWPRAVPPTRHNFQSFFASFCSQKEVLGHANIFKRLEIFQDS